MRSPNQRPPRENTGRPYLALVFELRLALSRSAFALVYDVIELQRRSAQEHDENNEGNWNSDEPKQNRHGFSPFVFRGLAANRGVSVDVFVRGLLAPGSVAEAAAFGGGRRRGERTDK